MIRKLPHAAALLALCALLVYAPEIFTAVSAPYALQQEARVLLRIALCTSDDAAASAFYRAAAAYQKTHGSLHLRVTRASPDQLPSLPEPLPDVYVFSPGADVSPAALFLPLTAQEGMHAPENGIWDGMRHAEAFVTEDGTTLLCAVGASARESSCARDFLSYLAAQSAPPDESPAP